MRALFLSGFGFRTWGHGFDAEAMAVDLGISDLRFRVAAWFVGFGHASTTLSDISPVSKYPRTCLVPSRQVS